LRNFIPPQFLIAYNFTSDIFTGVSREAIMSWYVSIQGVKDGPFTDDRIKQMVQTGELKANDLVWKLDLAVWTTAARVPELFRAAPAARVNVFGMDQKKIDTACSTPTPLAFDRRSADASAAAGKKVSAGRQSYVLRHWRGEYSLPRSYWLNGFLAGLVIAAIGFVIPWDDLLTDAPTIFLVALVFAVLLEIAATLWQAVGIWRSANNYLLQGKPQRWGKLAKAGVVVGLIATAARFASATLPQIAEFAQIATGKDPLGNVQLRVIRNGSELEISGDIALGLTKKVLSTLDSNPKIRLIHLNSRGGRVGEARKLRDLIASRKLSTFTAAGCYSACTLAYAAGEKRLIAKGASLGFHQYAFPGVSQLAFRAEYEKDKRDWLSRGIDQAFIGRAFTTSHESIWKPSHQELFAAKFITAYPQSNEVGISGIVAMDQNSIENQLVRVPLFAALQAYESETYNKLVAEVQAGIKEGHSLAEVRAKIFPIAQSVYKRKLPLASNAALASFADMMIEQLQTLRFADPALCYQFLYPETQETAFDSSKHFTKEMNDTESKVMAEVIRTAATSKAQPVNYEEVTEPLKHVMESLAQRHGDAIRFLTNPKAGKPNVAESCALNLDFLQTVRRLPENDRGAVLRFMFAKMKS
jgi:hypothetical protein